MQGRIRPHSQDPSGFAVMHRLVWLAATACLLVSSPAAASEIELVTVMASEPVQIEAAPPVVDLPGPGAGADFDDLPPELSFDRHANRREWHERNGPASPVLMIEQPKLGPLTMEQPVRVYENDVMVTLRAPGGRSSFATVELVF